MRINVFKEGGNDGQGSFITAGVELTGPLFLNGEHSQPLHAVPKQYADNLSYNISADQILTDTLPIGRMPGLTGDLTTVQGTNLIILGNTGVTPGSVINPSVDSKGRITGGNQITANDIDSVSFNKLTSTPDTLAGYGITNAALKENGNISGELNLNHEPVDSDDVATKGYVDTVATTAGGLSSGDIVRKTTDITPDGFFKCNGGLVDKNSYAGLYNIIGTKFNLNNRLDNGQPWQYQGSFNVTQQDNISNWAGTTAGPIAACWSGTVVTKNYIYVLGGRTGANSYIATVYKTVINADGTLGSWSTTTALPVAKGRFGCFALNNRLFVIGGTTTNNVQVNSIHSCIINNDGSLGGWVAESTLPITLAVDNVLITKNRVYLLGGFGASAVVSTIYTATISSSGVLGSWVLAGSLPTPRSTYGLAVTKNRIYLISGNDSQIYSASIDSDGVLGTFEFVSNFPIKVGYPKIITTKNAVYLIGGTSDPSTTTSACYSSVYRTLINDDGTLGTWIKDSDFGTACIPNSVFVVNNKIYLLGGLRAASVWTTAGYVANFASGKNDYSEYYSNITSNTLEPGSGRPWQQQYQMNDQQSADITGWTTSTSLPVSLRASQVIVTKNRVYLFGGYNDSVMTSTVYIAVINSDGTLGVWTTSTSLPVSLHESQAIVTKNRVYLVGGRNESTAFSTTYTASINSDGTLGSWSTSTSLPGKLSGSQAIITKNRVYLVGGSNGSVYVSTVYTAPINSDGTLGTWSTDTSLPGVLHGSQAVVTQNRVYLLGGWNGTANVSTVYTAVINSDGTLGAWSTGSSIHTATHWASAFTTSSKIYLVGGYVNYTTSLATVQVADFIGGLNDYSDYYTSLSENMIPAGAGQPWQQQYSFNKTQDIDITDWTRTTDLPEVFDTHAEIVTKNRVYLIGGSKENSTESGRIYTAPINSDGTLGTWTLNSFTLPTVQGGGQTLVIKNKVYLVGGYNATGAVSLVYVANINSDGTISEFVASVSLPNPRRHGRVFATKSYIYYIGGYNDTVATPTVVNTVYACPINSDGTLGSWKSATPLPEGLHTHQIFTTHNRIYVVGGSNGNVNKNTVYMSEIDSNGEITSWTTETPFPIIITRARCIATRKRVYIFLGYNSNGFLNTQYSAPINNDGTIGTWALGTNLPITTRCGFIFTTKSKIYLQYGENGTAPSGLYVYSASWNGGLNDYSEFYTLDISTVNIYDIYFTLPDYTKSDRKLHKSITSYIKY